MINTLQKYMPEMLINQKLDEQLQVFPEFSQEMVKDDIPSRLIYLQDLYQIYIPNQMSREIYSKMYLALMRSLQKKQTILSVRQSNENCKIIRQQSYESILGGSDSFTIIGKSGIGKSSAVSRIINILSIKPYFEINDTKIIPCLQVQAPADASVKGLLLEILRKTDEVLNTSYYSKALRSSNITVDRLIGSVSQISLNHIGLLVIDEIQNIVNSKHGKTIVGTLTQLINNSGVSICMVGTPESTIFFSQAMMLARRSLGLQYNEMEYGDEFCNFCNRILSYCYVKNGVDNNDATYLWLYNHSGGNASVVVSLIHDAQEISILNGYEKLDITSLNIAYEKRLTMLHSFLSPKGKTLPNVKFGSSNVPTENKYFDTTESNIILTTMQIAKSNGKDIITTLSSAGIKIEELAV